MEFDQLNKIAADMYRLTNVKWSVDTDAGTVYVDHGRNFKEELSGKNLTKSEEKFLFEENKGKYGSGQPYHRTSIPGENVNQNTLTALAAAAELR